MNSGTDIANHIHDALAQVRRLQELVLCRRRFKGYSGGARMVSGAVALAGAAALGSPWVPHSAYAHLAGWGIILILGLAANYGALLYWFVFSPEVRRNISMLKPALDALPALAVGAALSTALILRESFDLLPGVWLALYGLAQVAYRQSLPRGIWLVGLGYLVCGGALLLMPAVTFVNPWPTAICFLVGEWTGGAVLRHARHNEKQED